MMDEGIPRSSDTKAIDLSKVENKILEEFYAKQCIKHVPFIQNSKTFVVPKASGSSEILLQLEDVGCPYKRLIFSMMYTTYYRIFVLGDCLSKSILREFRSWGPKVIEFLNKYQFQDGKEIDFFRDYEAKRVNVDKVNVSSSGLAFIIRSIRVASEFDLFTTDGAWQNNFIDSALEIRGLKDRSDKEQVTLTDWFGYSTWLRESDAGIGHDLYCRLASPKALMSSFISTVTVQLHEIQCAKNALLSFLVTSKLQPSDFPRFTRGERPKKECQKEVVRESSLVLKKLQDLYHKRAWVKETEIASHGYLKIAIRLVIREFVYERFFDDTVKRFFDNRELLFGSKIQNTTLSIFRVSCLHEALFGMNFLNELASYAQLSETQSMDKPKTVAEHTIFSWIMAYQTVQPSDIPKLTIDDFRFLRRNNGKITHIDLEYFKGRANCIHQVRVLDTNSLLGTVVLNFIQEFSICSQRDKKKKLTHLAYTKLTVVTKMFESCASDIREAIDNNLRYAQASPVFIEAMLKIIKNGIRHENKTMTKSEYNNTCVRRIQKGCFGLTAIKNSSVHARSDTFTPTQLINYHSHTDMVERRYYLSDRNTEWLNRSGLITREVMNDMTVNLFRASEAVRAEFNSEFTRAIQTIDAKKNDTLSRLKLITEKSDGWISELGFVKKKEIGEDDLSDTIYLLDTPETVVKLMHYRSEVERTHRLLIRSAAEFLLFTALPTVEWIEELFDNKSFSKSSCEQGQKLYSKYKNHLAPLFQNQMR